MAEKERDRMRIKFTGYVGHIILNDLFQWGYSFQSWVANSLSHSILALTHTHTSLSRSILALTHTHTHNVTHTHTVPVLYYPDDKPTSL